MAQSDQEFFKRQMTGTEFPTTHWSVVLVASDSAAPLAASALEKFCRTYWPPVYTFIRRQSQSQDDALDLTQEFFAGFLEKDYVRLADPKRGRLRCFMLSSIKNFLANEWDYAQAAKRGGGRMLLSLEQSATAETHRLAQVADSAATPDRAYEKQWALTLLDHALGALRQQALASDNLEQFEALKEFIWGGPSTMSQVEIALKLGVSPNSLRVAVHRLRRQYGEILRAEVGRTVTNPAEIDGELRHLLAVISS